MAIDQKREANLSLPIAIYHKALQIYKQMEDADAEGTVDVNLGYINLILGEDEQARDHFINAIELAQRNG
jgi:Flp pilus assembly protein TadD